MKVKTKRKITLNHTDVKNTRRILYKSFKLGRISRTTYLRADIQLSHLEHKLMPIGRVAEETVLFDRLTDEV